jgi:hypothetical protein
MDMFFDFEDEQIFQILVSPIFFMILTKNEKSGFWWANLNLKKICPKIVKLDFFALICFTMMLKVLKIHDKKKQKK